MEAGHGGLFEERREVEPMARPGDGAGPDARSGGRACELGRRGSALREYVGHGRRREHAVRYQIRTTMPGAVEQVVVK
jgi:hypothetical protein